MLESDTDYRIRIIECMQSFGHYGTNVSKRSGLELDKIGAWLNLPRRLEEIDSNIKINC